MVQEGEYAITSSPGIILGDTIADSDTLSVEPQPVYALVLTPPTPPEAAPQRPGGNLSVSLIFTGIFLLFLIIALRFRNNLKYVLAIFKSLMETRTRQNVFDDTVRETSLIVLLNILWCACAGIIVFSVYRFFNPGAIEWSMRGLGMLIGMAMAFAYTIFMCCAYIIVGWVFTDSSHTNLWVKGFVASQALMAPAFFLTALLALCQPETAPGVAIASAIVFIIGKLMFIWKGYRIFFSQFSSWVLFLCYLCSLEIIPLILCYRCATLLGQVM